MLARRTNGQKTSLEQLDKFSSFSFRSIRARAFSLLGEHTLKRTKIYTRLRDNTWMTSAKLDTWIRGEGGNRGTRAAWVFFGIFGTVGRTITRWGALKRTPTIVDWTLSTQLDLNKALCYYEFRQQFYIGLVNQPPGFRRPRGSVLFQSCQYSSFR